MNASYAEIVAVQARHNEYRRHEDRARRRHFFFFLLLLGLLALAAAACGPAGDPAVDLGEEPSDGPIDSYNALLEALEAADVEVEARNTEIDQPFLTPPARFMTVNGGEVQVLVYDSESAAAAEAALVGPDGLSVGTNMVTWIASPHFYRRDAVMALYIGDDPAVVRGLEAALGPQFAGAG